MIKISNLHKFYGKNSNKIEVLKGIDLSFHCRYCWYCAIGGNGGGTFQPVAVRFTGYLPAVDCR